MIRHILFILNILLIVVISINIANLFFKRKSRRFRLIRKETIIVTVILLMVLLTSILLRNTVFAPKKEVLNVEKKAEETLKNEKIVTSTFNGMDYYTYLPKGYKFNMPLIVYLHGDDYVKNKDLKKGGLYYFVKNLYGGEYPFVLIQPHTVIKSWDKKYILFNLKGLIAFVKDKYKTNPNKVVLIGHSRGAMGSWSYANYFYSDLSCVIPISGDGDIFPYSYANLPLAAYTTVDKSDSWNYNKIKKNVETINSVGGNAKFYSIKGYTHANIMYKVITKKLLAWAIKQ